MTNQTGKVTIQEKSADVGWTCFQEVFYKYFLDAIPLSG